MRSLDYLKTWVEVDAAAVRHNFHVAEKMVGNDVSIMAIVKANAYGHGLSNIGAILASDKKFGETGWFGIDSVEEALILRKNHKKNPMLILGYVPEPYYIDIMKKNISISLYDPIVLKSLAAAARKAKKKARVHLKIETGTYRQGVLLSDVPAFIRLLAKHAEHIEVEGIYTHFSDTENLTSTYYKEQLQQFERARELFAEANITPSYIHAAASASLLLYPETHFTMVRWGVGLYGMYPSEEVKDVVGKKAPLKSAMVWKTRVVQIKKVPAGDTVGYDRTFKAAGPVTLAILPVGYGDGYWRHLSNKGEVLVRGVRAPVAGNICMNIFMVDVTHIPGVRTGDEVVLLGRQKKNEITPEEVAKKIESINYEIPTRINPRILRVAEISTRINPDIERRVI